MCLVITNLYFQIAADDEGLFYGNQKEGGQIIKCL